MKGHQSVCEGHNPESLMCSLFYHVVTATKRKHISSLILSQAIGLSQYHGNLNMGILTNKGLFPSVQLDFLIQLNPGKGRWNI